MILKLIFKLYRKRIEELFVDEIIGIAPASIKEPVFRLLREQQEPFQKWLVWSSWNIQKRLSLEKGSEELKGILLHIRALMFIANESPKTPLVEPRQEKPSDPMDGVKKFLKK